MMAFGGGVLMSKAWAYMHMVDIHGHGQNGCMGVIG